MGHPVIIGDLNEAVWMLTLNGALVTIMPLSHTGLIMDKQLGECRVQSVEY